MTRLDADSQEQLDRRKDVGEQCINIAGGRTMEDRETSAADAISDILTALYGPAGQEYEHTEHSGKHAYWRMEWNEEALKNAQAMLDRAFRSYEGDAEDYTVEGEVGPVVMDGLIPPYDEQPDA